MWLLWLHFPRKSAQSSDLFPKDRRGNSEWSSTRASTLKRACAFHGFWSEDPVLLAGVAQDPCPINMNWWMAEQGFVLFCFHFCKPSYGRRGKSKLMPYACKNPSDIFYCNGRWQWLSEQKEHAWVKVNTKHLLGNKAPPGDLCSCSAS